jgi:hypothetical protein
MVNQPKAYPSYCSIKPLGVSQLLNGLLVNHRFPPRHRIPRQKKLLHGTICIYYCTLGWGKWQPVTVNGIQVWVRHSNQFSIESHWSICTDHVECFRSNWTYQPVWSIDLYLAHFLLPSNLFKPISANLTPCRELQRQTFTSFQKKNYCNCRN